MEAALRWLAGATPSTRRAVRLIRHARSPCGQSALTARRSDLFG